MKKGDMVKKMNFKLVDTGECMDSENNHSFAREKQTTRGECR